MVGKLIIGGFGLLVILYGSTWQWRLLGVVLAVCAFAAAVGGALMRPGAPARPRPVAPAPEKAVRPAKKAKPKAGGG